MDNGILIAWVYRFVHENRLFNLEDDIKIIVLYYFHIACMYEYVVDLLS